MYNEVLEHFSKNEYAIPGLEKGELTELERFFISYECILRWVGMYNLSFHSTFLPSFRYLRATKWTGSEPAIERLEATLKWRREYGLYDVVTHDLVEPEVIFHSMLLCFMYINETLTGCNRKRGSVWV